MENIPLKPNEEWKPIVIDGITTEYMISNFGRVYSKCSKLLLKTELSNAGYYRVTLYINKKPYHKSIHRLVAIAFVNNPDNLPIVNHIDGEKINNVASNLEWSTYSENNYHAFRMGLHVSKYGSDSHLSKYTDKQVRQACQYMEDGEMTLPTIAKKTKIDIAMIYCIKNRKSWVNISIEYDVENCKSIKAKYTEEQMYMVYKLLSENELSIYEISDITKVKTSTIYNVILHRDEKFKFLNDIFDVGNYTSHKILDDFSDDIKDAIDVMLKLDKSPKDISKVIHNKYNINEDRVRHYTTRRKKILK